MSPESKKIIDFHFGAYRRQGAKGYRRKQYGRLLNIINDIFDHEPSAQGKLDRIGRKQIIGYWCRTEDETEKTRIEKWRVLAILFKALKKPSPPRPRKKCRAH
ncbi:hypothetical protein [Photobacterium rosenbergii]|uniref:hypothetical protein n=1 Tax=Photobacterium rosenbergii TaxID=294936 RepID=UPI001C9940D7|nr:hypothetical protein [Photobacterium rosenbergii]MBY5949283.1 hypothetical protein [Photobacterium rosenbergii]